MNRSGNGKKQTEIIQKTFLQLFISDIEKHTEGDDCEKDCLDCTKNIFTAKSVADQFEETFPHKPAQYCAPRKGVLVRSSSFTPLLRVRMSEQMDMSNTV